MEGSRLFGRFERFSNWPPSSDRRTLPAMSSRWLRIGIHLWPFRFWLCFPFLKLDLVKVYAGDDWGFTLLSFGGEAKPRRALFKVTVWDRLVYLWLFWLPPLAIMYDPWFGATWRNLGDWGSGMGDTPADQPFQEDAKEPRKANGR